MAYPDWLFNQGRGDDECTLSFRVLDPGAYGDSVEALGAKIAFVHPKSGHGVAR
jgi:hypothetical protein